MTSETEIEWQWVRGRVHEHPVPSRTKYQTVALTATYLYARCHSHWNLQNLMEMCQWKEGTEAHHYHRPRHHPKCVDFCTASKPTPRAEFFYHSRISWLQRQLSTSFHRPPDTISPSYRYLPCTAAQLGA